MSHHSTKYVPRIIKIQRDLANQNVKAQPSYSQPGAMIPTEAAAADGPIYVASREALVAAVPSFVKQFPVSSEPQCGSSSSQSANLYGCSPRPHHSNVAVEQQKLSVLGLAPSRCLPASYDAKDWQSVTKNEFGGGGDKGGGGRNGLNAPAGGSSSSTGNSDERLAATGGSGGGSGIHPPGAALTIEQRKERTREMQTSAVTLGDTYRYPMARNRPHNTEALPAYGPAHYAAATSFGIGTAGAAKTHSSVVVGGDDVDVSGASHGAKRAAFETTTRRQFATAYLPHPAAAKCTPAATNSGSPSVDQATQEHQVPVDSAAATAAKKRQNKLDMVASHFALGDTVAGASGATDYRTVASTPLPSTAPLVKNRPPSAPDRQRNQHVVHDASEARPPRATPQQIAESKTRSSVPLMGGGGPSATTMITPPPAAASTFALNDAPSADAPPAGLFARSAPTGGHHPPSQHTLSKLLPKELTATSVALPRYVAVRRRDAATVLDTTGSSLSFGTDKVVYQSVTKGQHQGVCFGQQQQTAKP